MVAKANFQSFMEQNREQQRLQTRTEIEQQDIFVEDDPVILEKKRSTESLKSVSMGMKREKLAYIHEMLGELRKLSLNLEEPMVAYLIEMALLETDTAINVGDFTDEFSGKPESGIEGA